MRIVGIIVWVVAVLWAVTYGFVIREKAKREQASQCGFEIHAFLLAVSVIIVPVFSLSPFHLLWMVPASFILALNSVVFPPIFLRIPASLYGSLWYIGTRNPGRAYYLAGDYARAIECYEELVRSKPKSAEAHFYLGLAYDKAGNTRRAIEEYTEVVRLNPTSDRAYNNLGLAYKGLDNGKAIEAFKEAIRIKPDYAMARRNLGMTYVEVGDIESAMQEYERLKTSNEALADELYAAINAG